MTEIIAKLEAKRLQLGMHNGDFAKLIGVSPSQWSLLKKNSRNITWWFFNTVRDKLSQNEDEVSESILTIVKNFLSENFAIARDNNPQVKNRESDE